ncbi:hypothetical protein [Priestia megaterium]|nr:hypothetical protein [Priestia megaterium]
MEIKANSCTEINCGVTSDSAHVGLCSSPASFLLVDTEISAFTLSY